MRSTAPAVAIVGGIALSTATLAFLGPPSLVTASKHLAHSRPGAEALQTGSIAASAVPHCIGIWCISGIATVVALSSKRRLSSSTLRGAVAVKVEKTASQIVERLQEAISVSADIEQRMGDLKEKNRAIVGELEATTTKIKAMEGQRDELKAKLGITSNITAQQLDAVSKLSDDVEETMAGMQARSTSIMTDFESATAKVQALEEERGQLKFVTLGLIMVSGLLAVTLVAKLAKQW